MLAVLLGAAVAAWGPSVGELSSGGLPLAGALAAAPAGILLAALGWRAARAVRREASRADAAEEALAQHRLIVDHASGCVLYVLDRDGCVRTWNQAAQSLLGYAPAEVIGRHCSVFYEPDAALNGEPWMMMRRALIAGVARHEQPRRRRDGTSFWAEVTVTPVRTPTGQLLGFVKAVRDVSERRRGAEDLRRHAAEISAVNTRLNQQADELRSRAIELDAARAAAVQAARAKSAFFDNVSHEIRSPMAAILGYSDLLAGGCEDAGERAVAVDAIRRTGRHLLGVINDLLDASKIESGRLTVDRTFCPLGPVLADLETMLRGEAHRKGIELRIDFDGPVPATITTDPLRLRQILLNLAGNAVKFTDHGSVRLAVSADAGARVLRVAVRDTGPGISPEVAAGLFQPFAQGEDRSDRRFRGTGLGLALARSLARLLGGDVTLESTPGAGSTFTLTIATGPIDGVPLLSAHAEGAGVDQAADADQPLKGFAVLLADDSADLRRLLSVHLRRAGATVTLASNGDEAAAHVLARPAGFDLVLMDLQMPVCDGLTATRRLRAAGVAVPVLALTASDAAAEADCRAAGCHAMLLKPIGRDALIEACRRAMLRPAPRRAA